MSTKGLFNNRVTHTPSLIKPSPSELTDNFASFTYLNKSNGARFLFKKKKIYMTFKITNEFEMCDI